MKAWQLFTLATALFMAGCTETPTETKKTDWEVQSLEGKVKQIKALECRGFQMEGDSVVLISDSIMVTSIARFDEIGQIAEREYYNKREFWHRQINMYDGKGNKHEIHSVNLDGSLREKSHYEFDENGNIVKRTIIRGDTVFSERNYTIDANGNTTTEIDYDPSGKVNYKTITPYDENSNRTEYLYEIDGRIISWLKYSYDEFGNVVESLSLDSLGNIRNRTANKYDEKGNAVETSVFNAKGEEALYLKKYNEEGKLIERITRPADGSPETRTTNKYNEKGALIETIQYNSDNSIKSHRKEEYKYDAKGNWIKRIIFVNDSVLLPVYLREIEYYE